jgi:plastocyanin
MLRSVRAVALAVILAGCAGGGQALGDAQAPASLDPDSPTLVAKDIAFDRTDIVVPAGRPFVLVFENQETAAHNVSVYADEQHQQRLFEGVVVTDATRWYPIPALAPGTYLFQCDIHPGTMVGHLRASL